MEWLILGIVVALTVINVPIGFALSISAIILLIWKGTASLSVVPLNLFSGASSFPLLAIPLFILAGGLMETSGISLRLVNLANSFVGFIRGGLAMVTVVATMIQSEISGSSVADAAAIGNVVIPAMEKRGYPRALSAAIVSNAASAAILIPPSIPMIIYAWMAETSVAKLFFAGFLPGFIACGAMMVLCYYYARKYNLPVEQKFSVRQVGKSTIEALWALSIPVVIWGGIFLGIATATEVAALAVLAAFIIGVFVYRELPTKETATRPQRFGRTNGRRHVDRGSVSSARMVFDQRADPAEVCSAHTRDDFKQVPDPALLEHLLFHRGNVSPLRRSDYPDCSHRDAAHPADWGGSDPFRHHRDH